MKLRLKTEPRRTFDVPRDIAEVLLLWENCPLEEIPPAPHPGPRTTWQVLRGANSNTLVVSGKCGTCGDTLIQGGKNAADAIFIHCRTREAVPKEIQKEFLTMYKGN